MSMYLPMYGMKKKKGEFLRDKASQFFIPGHIYFELIISGLTN